MLSTSGDGRPTFTAGLCNKPAVKITFTNSLAYVWAMITMLQHNKIHNFYKKKSDENKFYIEVVDLDEMRSTTLRLMTFLFEIVYGPRNLFEALIF